MNDQKALKFILYARKSSESEDRQVQSIDDQINQLTELAKRNGLKIEQVLVESKSAKTPYTRPVFEQLVKLIEKKKDYGILCWSMNRLFRNPVDQGTIGWLLQSGQLNCIQTIDKTYMPEDNVLLFNVEGGMANQYIIDLRRMCKRGLMSKVQKGWRPCLPPIGYLNNKEDRTIVVDPERFDLVRKMWDLMLSGTLNPKEILDIANNQWGLRTAKHKRKGGERLTLGAIYKIFSNIFYTGIFQYGGDLFQGIHKPMITLDEFDTVQELLGRKGKKRQTPHDFAYTGIMRCGACESMYTASQKTKMIKATNSLKTFTYYHCSHRKNKGQCNKELQRPIAIKKLENIFCEILSEYTLNAKSLEWSFELIDKKAVTKKELEQKKLESINHDIRELEAQIENLSRQFYRGFFDEPFYINEKKLLNDRLIKIKNQRQANTHIDLQVIEQTKKAFQFASFARECLLKGSNNDKRTVIQTIGSNWVINGEKPEFINTNWLLPIKDFINASIANLSRFEPEYNQKNKGQNSDSGTDVIHLCDTIEAVRTEIEKNLMKNSAFNIPDLPKF